MLPPYKITTEIIHQIASISEKMGHINAKLLDKPSPKLRKANRIKTIHSSLSIEGNTLTAEQITALLENKRVIGPAKDISEVMNAIEVYKRLSTLNPNSINSFLSAHASLMKNLVGDCGKFRKKSVGVIAGDQLSHLAPPADQVPQLMRHLFNYLEKSNEITLIKSCVFHYEMEFIHPFSDGNGRMGRLWQTCILMQTYPVFEYIPFENLIYKTQDQYYKALSTSDKTGSSTPFIQYMLNVIDDALNDLLDFNNRLKTAEDRLTYFYEICPSEFTRKDYMNVFKDISTATASRDLAKGILIHLFEKEGDKAKTTYKIKREN